MTDLKRLLHALEDERMELERLILATPTGAKRELLTEANIHMMTAISKLVYADMKE